MKLLVVVVILVGLDPVTCSTVSCSYYCTRSVRYTTGCGLFNWWRCTRYRAEGSTCYKTGVNGAWSSWSTSGTGSCSVTCGLGTRLRTDQRRCNNPAPTNCGATCPGNNTRSEQESCNAGCCPVSGGWSDWELQDSSTCSVTCGGGTQNVTYQRKCNNPATSCGGVTCSGSSTKVEKQSCSTNNCPVHGGWSSWYLENTSSCSVTCGEGKLTRTYRRHCDSPAPQFGGRNCTGDNTRVEILQCSTQSCPVDGSWSDWSQWHKAGECSALCGGGQEQQVRKRKCDNPAPAYGGRMCDGDEQENRTITCNQDNCADRCPQESITFIPHTTNNRLYYQCDNGVAVLRQCGVGTVWDQLITTCVHDGSQQPQGHEQKTECDPSRVLQPHPSDCTKFLLCSNGQGHEMTCPAGLYFSDVIGACDFATSVTCETA